MRNANITLVCCGNGRNGNITVRWRGRTRWGASSSEPTTARRPTVRQQLYPPFIEQRGENPNLCAWGRVPLLGGRSERVITLTKFRKVQPRILILRCFFLLGRQGTPRSNASRATAVTPSSARWSAGRALNKRSPRSRQASKFLLPAPPPRSGSFRPRFRVGRAARPLSVAGCVHSVAGSPSLRKLPA